MKNLKLFFKSLISNPAAIEGGRTKSWWRALILGLVSVLLAITPIFVSNITTSGTKFVDGTTYEFNYGVVRFTEHLYDNNIDMVIGTEPASSPNAGKKYLSTSLTTWQNVNATTRLNRFEYKNGHDLRLLEVYYTDLSGEEFTNYCTSLKNNKVPGSLNNTLDGEIDSSRTTSFIVFGKYNVVSYLYSPINTTPIGSFYGDYENLTVNSNLKTWATFNLEGVDYSPALDNDPYIYVNHVWNTWKTFFTESSHNTRMTSTWSTTGIMAAVDAGLIVFMGLIIFLLTRGKANPFRIYTFWECQKIVYWAALAPAVLSLILGFIIQSYAIVFFIMFLGLRMMWMSMKNLRISGSEPVSTKK